MSTETGEPGRDILDLKYLDDFAGNDAATMRELIDIFMEHGPQLIADLRSYCDSKQIDKLRRAAHKMKPMLAYVGMNSIRMRVTEIEDAEITDENWDWTAAMVSSVCSDFEIGKTQLAAFRKTLGD